MNGSMMDLPTTMSKCLALDMPLGEVIKAATSRPAEIIGHPELGSLTPGSPADVALWTLREGTFGFKDSAGGRITGDLRLECEMTFLNGEVMWDLNARDAVPYSALLANAGIREGEFLVCPVVELNEGTLPEGR